MANLAEFDHIDSAFSALIFGHEGLRAPEPFSQTGLSKACALSCLNELFPQFGVLVDFH